MALGFFIKNTLSALLLPPGGLLLLGIVAMALWNSRPKLARSLLALAGLLLYALSIPPVANGLLMQLEPAPITAAQLHDVDAIVCLGGGKRVGAYDQMGGESVNTMTLARLRYCAQLAKRSGKPILVSGGAPRGGLPEAQLMATSLQTDFGVLARWIEAGSDDTRDNATGSATLLLPQYQRIAIVSQAWHLPRALAAYHAAGFTVVAAPTDFANREPLSMLSFLPRAKPLLDSSDALHELLGSIWYALRAPR